MTFDKNDCFKEVPGFSGFPSNSDTLSHRHLFLKKLKI